MKNKENNLKISAASLTKFNLFEKPEAGAKISHIVNERETFYILALEKNWFLIEVKKGMEGWVLKEELISHVYALSKYFKKNSIDIDAINLFTKISQALGNSEQAAIFNKIFSSYLLLKDLQDATKEYANNPFSNSKFSFLVTQLIDEVPPADHQGEMQHVQLISGTPGMASIGLFGGASRIPCLFGFGDRGSLFERLPEAFQKLVNAHRGDPALPIFLNEEFIKAFKAINNLIQKIEPLQHAYNYFHVFGEAKTNQRLNQLGNLVVEKYHQLGNENRFSILPIGMGEIPDKIEPVLLDYSIGLSPGGPFLNPCNFDRFTGTVHMLRCTCTELYRITSIVNLTSAGDHFCVGDSMEINGTGFGEYLSITLGSTYHCHVLLPGHVAPIVVDVLPENWTDTKITFRVPDQAVPGVVEIRTFCHTATHNTVIDITQCGIVWKRGSNAVGHTNIYNSEISIRFRATNVEGTTILATADSELTLNAESCTPVRLELLFSGNIDQITIADTLTSGPLFSTNSVEAANHFMLGPDINTRDVGYIVAAHNICSGRTARAVIFIHRTKMIRIFPSAREINSGDSVSIQVAISCSLDTATEVLLEITGGSRPNRFGGDDSTGLFFDGATIGASEDSGSFRQKRITMRPGTTLSDPILLKSERMRSGRALVTAYLAGHEFEPTAILINPIEVTMPVTLQFNVNLDPGRFEGDNFFSTTAQVKFPVDPDRSIPDRGRSVMLLQIEPVIPIFALSVLAGLDLNIDPGFIPVQMTRTERGQVSLVMGINGKLNAWGTLPASDSFFEGLTLSTLSIDPVGNSIGTGIRIMDGITTLETDFTMGGSTTMIGGTLDGRHAKLSVSFVFSGMVPDGIIPQFPFYVGGA